MKYSIVLLVLGAIVLGCLPSPTRVITPEPSVTPAPTIELLDDLEITMERTICFGTCPAYRLTILGSGTVIYEGQENVQVTGRRISSIPREKVKSLVAELDRLNFFSLQDYTRINMTDMPSVFITVRAAGKSKMVQHYQGDESAPATLTALETMIDQITRSEQWVGKP